MMIAMVILVFISFAIYNITASTFKLRDVLGVEGDFYNGIRLSMGILERDVAALFTPMNLSPAAAGGPGPGPSGTPPPPGAAGGAPVLAGDLARASKYWNPALDASGLRPSRLIGTDVKLSLVSASHVRLYKNSPESEFVKVSYEVGKDERADVPDTMVLTKRVTVDAFNLEEDEKGAKSYPLMQGIRKWKFRYFRDDGTASGKWSNEWDSEKDEYRNRYPDQIEIQVEVAGRYNLSFEGVYRIRPETNWDGLPASF